MKKKLLAVLVLLLLLSVTACGNKKEQVQTSTQDRPEIVETANATAEDEMLDVTLNIETEGENGKPVFRITTNLPDNTVLKLRLEGDQDYTEFQDATVTNGEAVSVPFSNNNEVLLGKYTLLITMMPYEQPDTTKKITGEKGEFLTGEFFVYGKTYNFIKAEIEYESPCERLPEVEDEIQVEDKKIRADNWTRKLRTSVTRWRQHITTG